MNEIEYKILRGLIKTENITGLPSYDFTSSGKERNIQHEQLMLKIAKIHHVDAIILINPDYDSFNNKKYNISLEELFGNITIAMGYAKKLGLPGFAVPRTEHSYNDKVPKNIQNFFTHLEVDTHYDPSFILKEVKNMTGTHLKRLEIALGGAPIEEVAYFAKTSFKNHGVYKGIFNQFLPEGMIVPTTKGYSCTIIGELTRASRK